MKEWERQKGESSKSFAWFKIYRNLGPLRTFQKVIDYIENQPKQTKTLPNNQNKLPTPTVNKLKNLSYKWEWSKRCTAWDNYHDEQEQLQYNEAYKKTKDRLIDMGNDILDVTENILDELNCDERSQATSKAHAVKSLSDSFEKTTKTIRLLYNKSTEIKDGKTEVNAEVEAKVDNNVELETSQSIILDPDYVELSKELLNRYSEN